MKNENVLCVNAGVIHTLFASDCQYRSVEESVLQNLPFEFVERQKVESDTTYKQLIPYALIVNENAEVLYYHRCGSEKRLEGICSAGLGGHVNDTDTGNNVYEKLRSGLRRELLEEIGLEVAPDQMALLGMINEEETEVGHVHTGVVFQVNIDSKSELLFDTEIGSPRWERPMLLNMAAFEKWSALALQLKTSQNKRLLISILSDYLEPNFLLIKELEGNYDELVFITTRKTRKTMKDVWLLRALNIADSKVRRIEVIEDDVNVIQKALVEAKFSKDDTYYVNITGGTKVMSIAVYNFFSHFNALSYYVPVDRNEIRDMDGKQQPIELRYRMNLKEYFTLYGLYYEPKNTLLYPFKQAQVLFEKMKLANFNRTKIPEIYNAQTLPNNTDRVYYAGGWFEEYVYSRLKKELGLNDDEICKGAKIYRKEEEVGKDNQVDNEIDVMFLLANKLYIFECKMSISQRIRAQEQVEAYLYKLAAISKDFGLKVNSYLVTLHNMKEPFNITQAALQNIRKRQQILGIKKIIDCNDFLNKKLPIF